MPPVLHIALRELMGGGQQNLVARNSPPRDAQRHHILQLIAEAIGAAYLVETSATPDPAGQRLVEQPAIQQNIHAGIGCRHLHVPQRIVPAPLHLLQHRVQIFFAVTPQQLARAVGIFGLAQKENDLDLRSRLQVDHGLQRTARVEPRANFAGEQTVAFERRRAIRRTIAAEKLGAISGIRSLLAAERRECYSPAEFVLPRAARQQRLRFRIHLGGDVRRGCPRTSQHPFHVGRDG